MAKPIKKKYFQSQIVSKDSSNEYKAVLKQKGTKQYVVDFNNNKSLLVDENPTGDEIIIRGRDDQGIIHNIKWLKQNLVNIDNVLKQWYIISDIPDNTTDKIEIETLNNLFTPPTPLVPGPLDYISNNENGLTNAQIPFDLASPDIIVGIAVRMKHNSVAPIFTISHGGEPLTIIRTDYDAYRGILTAIALGHGLTMETANLEINVTQNQFDVGIVRIDEMSNLQENLVGWVDGAVGYGNSTPELTATNLQGGVIKQISAWSWGRNNTPVINNTKAITDTWGCAVSQNLPMFIDMNMSSDNWSSQNFRKVDNTYVSSNDVCQLKLNKFDYYPDYYGTTVVLNITVPSGSYVDIKMDNELNRINGPFDGEYVHDFNQYMDLFIETRYSDIIVKSVEIYEADSKDLFYIFTTCDNAVNGDKFSFTYGFGPVCTTAAEVLGEDFQSGDNS